MLTNNNTSKLSNDIDLENTIGKLLIVRSQELELNNRLQELIDQYRNNDINRSDYKYINDPKLKRYVRLENNNVYEINISLTKLDNPEEIQQVFEKQIELEDDFDGPYNIKFLNLVAQLLICEYQMSVLTNRLASTTIDSPRNIFSKDSGFMFKHRKNNWYSVYVQSKFLLDNKEDN